MSANTGPLLSRFEWDALIYHADGTQIGHLVKRLAIFHGALEPDRCSTCGHTQPAGKCEPGPEAS